MFIKKLFEVVLERFDDVVVIVLSREVARVLKSFIELRYFTTDNPVWPNWLTQPGAVTAAPPCVQPLDELDSVDRSIAYLLDIETRGSRFAARRPHVPRYSIRSETRARWRGVEALFDRLRLTPTDLTRAARGQQINQCLPVKARYGVSAHVTYCRDRVHRYLERVKSQGIPLPSDLALEPIAAS